MLELEVLTDRFFTVVHQTVLSTWPLVSQDTVYIFCTVLTLYFVNIGEVPRMLRNERLRKTGLWTLEDRRVRVDLLEVYKIVHGFSPVNFNTFLNVPITPVPEDIL